MARAVIFREPALVKAVTTLDVRSGGRAWPGIGAGYQHEEGAALGLPMPPTAERFERLGEALRIALAMRAGDQRPIQGMADRPHVAGHRLRWWERTPARWDGCELAAAEAQLLFGEVAGELGALSGWRVAR
jgi:alkanesulfonate monooxygenase SsuD/methylene tetrahydromethanopterin reductase-like flavin-dependent oxidoreductase (luciferase family)